MTDYDIAARTDAWADSARVRISRRRYDADPITSEEAARLSACCESFRPFTGARVVLLPKAPKEIFTGWLVGSYGKVESPSALVFLGDSTQPQAAAQAGYTAQGTVLEATAMGLGTCWIGGGVKRAQVASIIEMAPDERIYSISALGRVPQERTRREQLMASMVRAERRKPTESLVRGEPLADWPAWAIAGVELARRAPSAKNRQPWLFDLGPDGVTVTYEGADTPLLSKRLDCGIAMLQFELGAREHGSEGAWSFGQGRRVATWRPR